MPESISRLWNIDENYWLLHPQMKTIKLFGELFAGETNKKKEKTSKLMWAIALYCDPHEQNPWRNISDKDKRELIACDFLGDKDFNWEDKYIQDLISKYQDHCLTIGERELVRFQTKLVERSNFIYDTKYTLDEYEEDKKGSVKIKKGTAKQLDDMVVDTVKIYEHLEKIKQMVVKEKTGQLKGGQKESASEQGAM